MADLIGTMLGRYRITALLGEGGMATVYKALDTHLEREVAVKVIRRNAFSPEVLERVLKRFDREAKALARLTHPNIVSIIDYGEQDCSPYLVMPYLPGGTLKQMMAAPMPYQQAARLLVPIAEALAFAHQQGIVHRDVKPGNILITASGKPMLTDFGIARLLEQETGSSLTGTGMGIGTPEYMAPEQFQGADADAKVDIYALGVVFYEMLTGCRPYTADTPAGIAIKQATQTPPDPRDFVAELPESVVRILTRGMAKDPTTRYQTMDAFAAALDGMVTTQATPIIPHPVTASLAPQTQPNTLEDETGEVTADLGLPQSSKRSKPAPALVPEPVVQSQPAYFLPAASTPIRQPADLSEMGSPRPKNRAWLWIVGGVFLVLFIIGMILGDIPSPVEVFPTAVVQNQPVPTELASMMATELQVTEAPTEVPIEAEISVGTYEIIVAAKSGWIDTGIRVSAGQTVTITYLSGTWSACAPPYGCGFVDASGDPNPENPSTDSNNYSDNVMNGCHAGALIARIGNYDPFCVGNYYTAEVDQTGRISFAINDKTINDNGGEIKIQIEVK